MRTPLALSALQLFTKLPVEDVSDASYELFETIMAFDDMTDQDWAAARFVVRGAFRGGAIVTPSRLGERKEILKFLDYHLGLQGAGEDHRSSIFPALKAFTIRGDNYRADPRAVESMRKFNFANPPFVRGIRWLIRPDSPFVVRGKATNMIALMSDHWFNSPVPVMEPGEMSEFCEHLAVFIIDDTLHGEFLQICGVTILFGMLRSPEWRKHVVPRFWSVLAYCSMVDEEQESFRWCLQNAIELLEFTRGLADGEGLKWWHGVLWFYYDKLDTAAQEEVERIARDVSLGDGLSDLNLYLSLIGQEAARVRKKVHELPNEDRPAGFGTELRARLVALEGNYNRLGRITGWCR